MIYSYQFANHSSKFDCKNYLKANQFLGYPTRRHPRYAAAIMVPVALAFLFTVNQWAKNESGWKKKLVSLPFLLLQLYPPFAALRLVVYLITRNRKWFDANKVYNQSVASIGKILFYSLKIYDYPNCLSRGNFFSKF